MPIHIHVQCNINISCQYLRTWMRANSMPVSWCEAVPSCQLSRELNWHFCWTADGCCRARRRSAEPIKELIIWTRWKQPRRHIQPVLWNILLSFNSQIWHARYLRDAGLCRCVKCYCTSYPFYKHYLRFHVRSTSYRHPIFTPHRGNK